MVRINLLLCRFHTFDSRAITFSDCFYLYVFIYKTKYKTVSYQKVKTNLDFINYLKQYLYIEIRPSWAHYTEYGCGNIEEPWLDLFTCKSCAKTPLLSFSHEVSLDQLWFSFGLNAVRVFTNQSKG